MSTPLRRWLSVLLIGLVTLVTPLAYSDLPDQTWISGYYDGGDEDDAVIQIQIHLPAVAPPAPVRAPQSVLCSTAPQPAYVGAFVEPILSAGLTRAPPASHFLPS